MIRDMVNSFCFIMLPPERGSYLGLSGLLHSLGLLS